METRITDCQNSYATEPKVNLEEWIMEGNRLLFRKDLLYPKFGEYHVGDNSTTYTCPANIDMRGNVEPVPTAKQTLLGRIWKLFERFNGKINDEGKVTHGVFFGENIKRVFFRNPKNK